jgi:Tol biopolymer transport system component
MRQTPGGRLDSWKEIAAYLGRDVTTAIRWEKQKGLPIHRVPGGKRSAVFAYRDEIDHWFAGAEADLERNGSPLVDGPRNRPAGSELEVRHEGHRRRWLLFGVVFGLVSADLVGITIRRAHPATPTSHRPMVQLTFDSGLTTDPAISKNGTVLAYASDRTGEGNLHIWIQDLRTGQSKRLTDGAFDDREPTISSDGQRVVFRSERDGGGLYSVPVQGGAPVLVARKGRRPRFSPDGGWIAYWTGTPGTGDPFAPGAGAISVVEVNSGIGRRLLPEFASGSPPVWSPDSKALLFMGAAGSHYPSIGWWIVPINGDAPKPVPADNMPEGCMPEEWSEEPKVVVCSSQQEGRRNLWRIPVDSGGIPATGQRQRLTSGEEDVSPSGSRAGDLVFASLQRSSSLRAVPVDAEHAEATGKEYTLTEGQDSYPSLSADGDQMTFVRSRDGNPGTLWRKDLASGREWEVVPGEVVNWQKQSPDGSFAIGTGRGILWGLRHGQYEVVCNECNRPWDVSPDHRWLTTISREFPRNVRLVDLTRAIVTQATEGSSIVLLQRPEWNLYLAHFSQDGFWMAFQAKSGPDVSRIYVAPFRGNRAVPDRDWIPITDGSSVDGDPVWSPGGNWLYFLSDRDGSRCVWAQALAAESKRPVGLARAIYHSHSARHSLATVPIGLLELTVSGNKLALQVGQVKGNIWMLK